jgi:hypothetical protein
MATPAADASAKKLRRGRRGGVGERRIGITVKDIFSRKSSRSQRRYDFKEGGVRKLSDASAHAAAKKGPHQVTTAATTLSRMQSKKLRRVSDSFSRQPSSSLRKLSDVSAPAPTAAATLSRMRYWEHNITDNMKLGALFPAKAGTYLSFEHDFGGFNNIRISFENLVVVALVTGRTLVLPPKAAWYLLDWGQVSQFKYHLVRGGGVLSAIFLTYISFTAPPR